MTTALAYDSILSGHDVLISYKGPLTSNLISEISANIRMTFNDHPKSCRKVFAVFMELAVNVFNYSAERLEYDGRDEKVGAIGIKQDESGFSLISCNLVPNDLVSTLRESCSKINTLDRSALRQYKREQRGLPMDKTKKGAGIGLIQIALTSESPLRYNFEEMNDEFSYFIVSVNIPPLD